jgi:MoxR-like ATPase
VQRHIERRMAEGKLTLDELIAELQAKFPAEARAGALPSRSATHRYGQKLQQRLDAVKASAEAARIISEQYGDKLDDRGAGLITMIQSELFESVMALSEAGAGDMSPEERVALLAAAGKNIGTLSRAGVAHKEFQARAEAAARKALLEEQRKKLDELGKTGEVAPEVLARVIKAAYDL